MSIRDVAEQVGVSIATVSRAFNAPDQVAPETRRRVMQAATQLGYVPNSSAQTLRRQFSKVLGVVLPALLNPVFAECLDGIAQMAAANGYSIVPMTTDYQLAGEEAAVNRLLAYSVDGMILVVSNPQTSQELVKLQARSLPYVLLYNRHADHPCVSVDCEGAMGQLIHRLAGMGHSRIAMVSGQLAASDRSQQRYRGYVTGMRECGLDAYDLVEVPFMDAVVSRLAQFLGAARRPSALVCSNDLLAIRCLRAAHVAGLEVPRDLTVVGFDGIELGRDLTPVLSTIAQPNREIGRRGVQLIVQALGKGRTLDPAASLTLSHEFHEGESCAPAAS